MHEKTRLIALCVVATLALTACGARTSSSELNSETSETAKTATPPPPAESFGGIVSRVDRPVSTDDNVSVAVVRNDTGKTVTYYCNSAPICQLLAPDDPVVVSPNTEYSYYADFTFA